MEFKINFKRWVIEADLDEEIRLSEVVSIMAKIPDIVIYWAKLKNVISMELTWTVDENINEKFCEKVAPYEKLVKD